MENLGWGLQMTVVGMGIVFALLALLWGLLHLVLKLDPTPVEPVSPEASIVNAERIAAKADDAIGAQVPVTPTVQGMDADLVAAIMVATLTHREIRRREAAPMMRSAWPGSQLYASRWVTSGRTRQNHSWQRGVK
jgi:Na+-transporting methylmalonyl-CoA/oxaloacetate decarboxylase gamma subunit